MFVSCYVLLLTAGFLYLNSSNKYLWCLAKFTIKQKRLKLLHILNEFFTEKCFFTFL